MNLLEIDLLVTEISKLSYTSKWNIQQYALLLSSIWRTVPKFYYVDFIISNTIFDTSYI